MQYPKQEIHRRATVSRREIVDIFTDAASGGSSNPSYTNQLAVDIPAEVLQVTGGESIRGKQVEANTRFVISIRHLPDITFNARCKVDIKSGAYSGTSVYTHRIHTETDRARPMGLQLHCGNRES